MSLPEKQKYFRSAWDKQTLEGLTSGLLIEKEGRKISEETIPLASTST